ncbi:MAG TPA: hypothetical protein VFR23_24165 [Jiangellaceae bacterium]|nr:hypothetical protein [Jiangellaceae bacterium]
MDLDVDALPFIDEHHVLVAAPATTVWRHLGAAWEGPGWAGRMTASLLAAVPRRASDYPLTQGAALPGFSVREAVQGERLALMGHHRFSEYALTFTLTEAPGGTRLSARTDARFPGIRGQLYRTLVIRSGGHRVVLMRLLRRVRRAAEADNARGT